MSIEERIRRIRARHDSGGVLQREDVDWLIKEFLFYRDAALRTEAAIREMIKTMEKENI